MRKVEIFKFGAGEVHNLKYMSKTVNDWAAAQQVRLIDVSISVDAAGYLFVAAIYDENLSRTDEGTFQEI